MSSVLSTSPLQCPHCPFCSLRFGHTRLGWQFLEKAKSLPTSGPSPCSSVVSEVLFPGFSQAVSSLLASEHVTQRLWQGRVGPPIFQVVSVTTPSLLNSSSQGLQLHLCYVPLPLEWKILEGWTAFLSACLDLGGSLRSAQ